MAKIGNKNPRYRCTEQMAKDIAFVINSKELSHGAQHDVIHGVTWQWTQRNGIYRGNTIWSKTAVELYKKDHVNTESRFLSKYFREEHIIPRKLIIEHLIGLEKPVDWKYVKKI